jgi:thermitase
VRFPLATVVAAASVAAALAAPAVAAADAPELIVRFEPGTTASERLDAREDAGTELQRKLPVPGMQLVEVEPGHSAAAAEHALEAADGVLYAEPNTLRRAFIRPNDPYFPQLWAMENTGQAIRGVTGVPDADSDVSEAWDARVGGGTLVAVVDTGVDGTHPDLVANLWRNPGESGNGRETNGLDDDQNGRVDDWRGWDFVGLDNDPADENGHGTHVSGTIAADRGNGVGVAGIADGAGIMPLRVLDGTGAGRVSDVILAYNYAFLEGARVVNLSLGSTSSSRAERDAIAAYPTMLFVAASGNGGADGVGDDNDSVATYPCAYVLPNVLCVAASDNRDQLASFSNYGARSVDLAAPGVNIASTWPGGGYTWSSGTSMATPHVSGAAALLWSAAPGASPTDISSAIVGGVDAAPAFVGRTAGGGRLNVLRSLRLVADVGMGAPAPVADPSGADGSGSSGGGASPPRTRRVSDFVAPRLSIRTSRQARSSRVLGRGLAIRARCSEACTLRLVVRAGGRAFTAPTRIALPSRSTRRIVLRPSGRGRTLLRRRGSVPATLVARAVDRAGNSHTLKLGLRFSR